MTPLTQNPTVIVYATLNGGIQRIATNVAEDINVQVFACKESFDAAAKGMPFQLDPLTLLIREQ
jgi:hypothetical protein